MRAMQVATILPGACVIALAACDPPAPRCTLGDFPSRDTYCSSATLLALRETAAIHIDDAAVAEVYDTLAPAWRAFPVTRLAQAWSWRTGLPDEVPIISTSPAIVDAWDAGRVATGDPAVDAVFLEHGLVDVRGKSTYGYIAHLRDPVNVTAYARLVATLPSTELRDEPYPSHGIDITLAWDGPGRIATFEIGWGDCFLGCIWRHTVVVSLPGDGTAAVIREYGDELSDADRALAEAIAPP